MYMFIRITNVLHLSHLVCIHGCEEEFLNQCVCEILFSMYYVSIKLSLRALVSCFIFTSHAQIAPYSRGHEVIGFYVNITMIQFCTYYIAKFLPMQRSFCRKKGNFIGNILSNCTFLKLVLEQNHMLSIHECWKGYSIKPKTALKRVLFLIFSPPVRLNQCQSSQSSSLIKQERERIIVSSFLILICIIFVSCSNWP